MNVKKLDVKTFGFFRHKYIDKKPDAWRIAVSKNTSKSRFINPPVPIEPYYTEERVLPIGAVECVLQKNGIRIENEGLPEKEDAAGEGVLSKSEDAAADSMRIYGIDRLICDVLKYEEKMDRGDFKTAVRAYIDDERKDIAKLLSYAKERKVLKKVQSMIGVWL